MSDETKKIIFFYLTLFALFIMPINIDGFSRTLKILQDNIRPFVVAFITLSFTIYLKIYNDVEKNTMKILKSSKKIFTMLMKNCRKT